MLNQQSKLLLTQLVMQLATFVIFIIIGRTFAILDYLIIFISIFFFAVVTRNFFT